MLIQPPKLVHRGRQLYIAINHYFVLIFVKWHKFLNPYSILSGFYNPIISLLYNSVKSEKVGLPTYSCDNCSCVSLILSLILLYGVYAESLIGVDKIRAIPYNSVYFCSRA